MSPTESGRPAYDPLQEKRVLRPGFEERLTRVTSGAELDELGRIAGESALRTEDLQEALTQITRHAARGIQRLAENANIERIVEAKLAVKPEPKKGFKKLISRGKAPSEEANKESRPKIYRQEFEGDNYYVEVGYHTAMQGEDLQTIVDWYRQRFKDRPEKVEITFTDGEIDTLTVEAKGSIQGWEEGTDAHLLPNIPVDLKNDANKLLFKGISFSLKTPSARVLYLYGDEKTKKAIQEEAERERLRRKVYSSDPERAKLQEALDHLYERSYEMMFEGLAKMGDHTSHCQQELGMGVGDYNYSFEPQNSEDLGFVTPEGKSFSTQQWLTFVADTLHLLPQDLVHTP